MAETPGIDHFNKSAFAAKAAAQLPERQIADAGHGRKDPPGFKMHISYFQHWGIRKGLKARDRL
jgi:hypothetical protein